MDNMTLIKNALESLGYNPRVDEDGDLYLCYQMKSFYFSVEDTEHGQFVTVVLAKFYELEDDNAAIKAITVCNKLNRELRLVKVFVNQTFEGVSATCEFYYSDEEVLKQNLEYSVAALGVIRTAFLKVMCELDD